MNVSAIFPTPVGLDKIDTLTEAEIKHILDYKNKTTKNFGNRITANNYVLEDKILDGLKSLLENKLQEYFFDVYKTKEATPYITQSWINFTDQNEFHHNHKHPNSFISGVFYLQAIENDRIVFTSNHDNMFEFQSEEFTLFNSKTWWIPVEDNTVIFFPSNMSHEVLKNNTDRTRISLAFNCFIKGSFGNVQDLKRLNL
jgi:uncharacterized protein (TIGR02466 family)